MPPVVPLPPIAVTPGGYSDEGRARARAQEQTVGAASVREYQPGDSMRIIHWPSTARQGEVYVRLFDGTPGSNSWILLDIDAGVQSGEGANSTEEHGIILAASLADRALNNRQAVGLVIYGQELTWVPAPEDRQPALDALQGTGAGPARRTETGAPAAARRPGPGQRSSLVIITASTRPDWLEALLPLAWRGITPTVLLLEPRSSAGSRDVAAVEELLQRMNISPAISSGRMRSTGPKPAPGSSASGSGSTAPSGTPPPGSARQYGLAETFMMRIDVPEMLQGLRKRSVSAGWSC